jgi:hypothetical protein
MNRNIWFYLLFETKVLKVDLYFLSRQKSILYKTMYEISRLLLFCFIMNIENDGNDLPSLRSKLKLNIFRFRKKYDN